MKAIADLTGRRYSRLVVLSFVDTQLRSDRHCPRWLCRCDCGNEKVILGLDLHREHAKSCGCLMRTAQLKHGMWKSPEYKAWIAMHTRCYNTKAPQYPGYGGRGIVVCERWLRNFDNFYADMGNRPSALHSLDRYPKQDGNYEPSNCRWATRKEQQRNLRSNRLIEFRGKTQCMFAWCEELGLTKSTLSLRLLNGWSIERALTTPQKAMRSQNNDRN